jgi:hypothetical protein
LGYHIEPCLVGRPIPGEPVDYTEAAVFVTRDSAPALSSLREQAEPFGALVVKPA